MTAIIQTPQCESAQSNHYHCTSSQADDDTLMEMEHPFFATMRNRFRRYRAAFVDLRLMIRQGPPGAGGGPPDNNNNNPPGPPSPPGGPPGGNHDGPGDKPPGSPNHTSTTDTTTTSTATENVTVTNIKTTTSSVSTATTQDSTSLSSSSQEALYPSSTTNSQSLPTAATNAPSPLSPSFTQTTITATSTGNLPSPPAISTVSAASNNKVTGPVVGGLLGALALFTILFVLILRRRRRAKQRPASFGDFDGSWVNRLNSRQLGTTGSGPREVSMARSLPASIVAPRVLHAGTQEGQMIYNAGLVNPFANPNTSVATLSTAPATHGHNNNDNGEASDDGIPIPNPFANAEIPLTPPSRARSSFAAVRNTIMGRPQSQSQSSATHHPDYDEFPTPPTPVDPFDPGRGVDTLRLRGSDGARYKALDAIV